MSTVWCCIEATAGKRVALKVIKPHPDIDDLEEEIFRRELNVERLDHPNIVRLLDHGRLPDTGQFYLVFEWADEDLTAWVSRNRPLPPDDFVEDIALPVLRGLAYAHERDVVHRDVKPSNVLIGADGAPMLSDFGISRMKIKLAGDGKTVRDFVSKPFAPPEGDPSSAYSRDVFSFGALLLWCLSEVPVTDYPDFSDALDDVDASPPLIELIADCVQLDEADRPKSASEVLFRLEQLQSARRKVWKRRDTLHLAASRRVVERIAQDSGIPTSHVPELLLRELGDSPAARLLQETPQKRREPGEAHFFIYGGTWRLHVASKAGEASLALIAARDVGAAECEQGRDLNLTLDSFDFVVGPPTNQALALDAVRRLREGVEQFDANRSLEQAQREELRLFRQWRAQLDAREAHDRRGGDELRFDGKGLDGLRLSLQLADEPITDLLEQRRRIIDERGFFVGSGLVEEVRGAEVVVYLDRKPRSMPKSGTLVLDRSLEASKLRRERNALEEVRRQSPAVLRPTLASLIVHPEEAAAPAPVEEGEVTWNQQLDESKQRAVLAGLGCEDFLVVEGPPGTGKTTFIAELIHQTLHRDPAARVLLTSQTHVALDNAIERLLGIDGDVRVLRVGNPASGKIAQSSTSLTVDHQLVSWRERISLRSERFLERYAQRSGAPLTTVRQAIKLRQAAAVGRAIDVVDGQIEERRQRIEGSADDQGADGPPSLEQIEDLQSEISTLVDRRKELQAELKALRGDRSVGEAIKRTASTNSWSDLEMSADALLDDAAGSDQLVGLAHLQADWIQRAGRGDDFKTALLHSSQVVGATCVGLAQFPNIGEADFDLCIVDEASKATATETLVPLVRSQRWVLVGDERQLPPFREEALGDQSLIAEFDLDPAEVGRSLFSRMRQGLPEPNRLLLSRQYRMVDAIGDLISSCFYSGSVESSGVRAPAWSQGLQPRPVTWYSTELLPSRRESRSPGGTSFLNQCEVARVVAHLERMEWLLGFQHLDHPVSILVVAPYRSQVYALQRAVANRQWRHELVAIEVNTVDAVQGREADVLIFSTTRSNESGNLGFVKDLARANVALSRGRYLLSIIGDAKLFDASQTPLAEVLGHIRTHPNDCSLEELEP